ncbi:MAG: polyprenyl synthetase family protein [Patescibacteria group bacterium]|nr:polyprenyl synthetase family protein [Patescibacteria group bacterium]
MKQATDDSRAIPSSLRELYAPIRDELVAVEDLMRAELASDHPFVDLLVKHGFRLGGKRLRPALVLLCARAVGGILPEHLRLAAAVELIHTATLIHDDVLDEAELRRHLETVNARWDNEASVLLGDYLYSLAMCLAASVEDGYACRTIGDAARVMCEGELLQVQHRGDYSLSEAEYYEIIAGKTGALLACCCRLGARYAQASEPQCAAMVRYGEQLGIAFQIADDLLDLTGDEATAGKSLGTDLVKQKATLPLIHLLATVSDAERESLMATLTDSPDRRSTAFREWFDRYASLDYARDKARAYARGAAGELSLLPAGPARASLEQLCDFVVSRRQ